MWLRDYIAIALFELINCQRRQAVNTNEPPHRPEVQLKYGRIRGTQLQFNSTKVNEYYGIPYAKPPIDELRFQKPLEPDNWTDTLDLPSRTPPPCSQPDHRIKSSEDCLYLNIWTPARASSTVNQLHPVFVYIHGGGYVYGSAMEQVFNASAWPFLTDVIVVTMNYRLAAFGFFHANRTDAPGNVAIWDQVWVLVPQM